VGKECQPSTSARRRISKKSTPSKTAQLQEKLEDLVSLLRSQTATEQLSQAQQQPAYQPETPDTSNNHSSTESALTSPSNVARTTNFLNYNRPEPGLPVSRSDDSVVSPLFTDDLSIYQISDAIAEEQLTLFLHALLPLFPFVYIPDQISVPDLRKQRPFLFLVIMSLTTKSMTQQLAMGDEIRRIVAEKIVIEHERSLDLLLGLVCFLAW
jgi:hypothetical protein